VNAAVDSLRGEDGLTLIELLLAATLMLIVLGATLTTFNAFERNVQVNSRQNDAQQQARQAMDLMARDLRNLASPTPELPFAVDVKEPFEVIFQSEGKEKAADSLNAQNTTRVRYCLNSENRKLYRQIQTWKTEDPPALPAVAACGAGTWTHTLVVASDVTNGDRPVFTYNAVEADRVTEVNAQVFVDVNPGKRPAETDLQTTVFLRNQNRIPTATFDWAPMPNTSIFLNASSSTDPEEKAMTFEWWDMSLSPATKVGDGIVYTYKAPAAGSRTIRLVVKDATLEATAEEEVCATVTGVTC
jgi:type II secretory pathway component PulJ